MWSALYSCWISMKLEFPPTGSRKILKEQFSWKSVWWKPSCSMRTDGHSLFAILLTRLKFVSPIVLPLSPITRTVMWALYNRVLFNSFTVTLGRRCVNVPGKHNYLFPTTVPQIIEDTLLHCRSMCTIQTLIKLYEGRTESHEQQFFVK